MIRYIIDLNADRCIYEEPGRTYTITPEDGHHYDGKPVKITVTKDKISYET